MSILRPLCPKWDQAIEIFEKKGSIDYVNYVAGNILDPIRVDRCIVAEAHGFNQEYDCKECDEISYEFLGAFSGIHSSAVPQSTKDFYTVRDIFVDHWVNKHV